MLKVVSEPVIKEISIQELVNKLLMEQNLIIFYLVKDKGTPVFFHKFSAGKFGFRNVIFSYADTYVSDSVGESLKEAAKNRQLYVAHRGEMENIFATLTS